MSQLSNAAIICSINVHVFAFITAFKPWYNEQQSANIFTLGSITPKFRPHNYLSVTDLAYRRKRSLEGLDFEIPLDCKRIRSDNSKQLMQVKRKRVACYETLGLSHTPSRAKKNELPWSIY